ncbi:MAG: DNA polymerase IV, partial [Chloroflexota bacterium]
MNRIIMHLDLDAFFCAVEELLDPSLRGKAFAVGGKSDKRGVIASCSYAARNMGVRSAMPSFRARQLCPDLIIVGRNGKQYGIKSKEVMKILRNITPNIEQISIDEAFIDATELDDDIYSLAIKLQKTILDQTGLSCSLGVASNKLVAKIATDVGKGKIKTTTYPNAIEIVPNGQEANFLAPLPADMLWGVGPKTSENLTRLGIRTIGDIAKWPSSDITRRFGKNGFDLVRRAQGKDSRRVSNIRNPKSYSAEITFYEDTTEKQKLQGTIQKQANRISASLRKANIRGSTIKLKLRWSDFTTITRQSTLPNPTNNAKKIYEEASNLLSIHWNNIRPVRLLGVGVSGFKNKKNTEQLSLWDSQ